MGATVVEKDQGEVTGFFKELGQSFYAPADPQAPVTPPHFLHLRDARIFQPDGQPFPLQEGSWWRGRLETVDGFMLGTLTDPLEAQDLTTAD
jgi:hypothetical protein